MRTISDTVEDIVRRSSFLEEALRKGILNLTALARDIRPEIEKKHLERVGTAAVVMALARLGKRLKRKNEQPLRLDLKDVTVETNLTEYTFANSPTLHHFHLKLTRLLQRADECMNFCQGVFETTIIVGGAMEEQVERIAKDERLIVKIPRLAAVTLRYPSEAVYQPGVYYPVLKVLAWEDINLIEVISVYSELTLIVREEDVDRAFSTVVRLSR